MTCDNNRHELMHTTHTCGVKSRCSCGWTPEYLFVSFAAMFTAFARHKKEAEMVDPDKVRSLQDKGQLLREDEEISLPTGVRQEPRVSLPVGRDKLKQRRYEIARDLMTGICFHYGEYTERDMRDWACLAIQGADLLLAELAKVPGESPVA